MLCSAPNVCYVTNMSLSLCAGEGATAALSNRARRALSISQTLRWYTHRPSA